MKTYSEYATIVVVIVLLVACASPPSSGSRETPTARTTSVGKTPARTQARAVPNSLPKTPTPAASVNAPSASQSKPVPAAVAPKTPPLAAPSKPIAAPAPPPITATPLTRPSPSAAPKQASASTHIIRPGDTLTKLAARYGVTETAIKSANSLQSDILVVGTSLRIPGK